MVLLSLEEELEFLIVLSHGIIQNKPLVQVFLTVNRIVAMRKISLRIKFKDLSPYNSYYDFQYCEATKITVSNK